MSVSLGNAQVNVALSWELLRSLTPTIPNGVNAASANTSAAASLSRTYTNGTGASQANQVFAQSGAINSGEGVSIDLYGALTNIYGQTINFTNIKALAIVNRSATNTLEVGGAAANAWEGDGTPFEAGAVVNIRPSGFLLLAADGGFSVTAGTKDILRLTHGSLNSDQLSYDIFILGVQA